MTRTSILSVEREKNGSIYHEEENFPYTSRFFWLSKSKIDKGQIKRRNSTFNNVYTWERPRRTEKLTKNG